MMKWPFERGRIYNRREHIHAPYGGQQQGGIVTPARYPIVILITGKIGRQHGYVDTLREDGVFEYVGEGQTGDMTMNKGNAAIRDHSRNGKDLLLFRKLGQGMLRFEGDWVCSGFRVERRRDTNNTERDALTFELCPLDTINTVIEVDKQELTNTNLAELRNRAIAAADSNLPAHDTLRSVIRRSRDVRSYVLARAGDDCEGCEKEAPFRRPDGSAYLEPHHLRRVSDGGPDHPAYVIALCPNCHRRVHFGVDGPTYNAQLQARMPQLEPA